MPRVIVSVRYCASAPLTVPYRRTVAASEPVYAILMQLVSESPGFAFASASMAVPLSLSSIATDPDENELPVLVVVETNAA